MPAIRLSALLVFASIWLCSCDYQNEAIAIEQHPLKVAPATIEQAQKLRAILELSTSPLQETKEVESEAPTQITLGRHLFYDPRLSNDGKRSCNSCHDLQNYGANGRLSGSKNTNAAYSRDVPSIYNVSSLLIFDWDGRHESLRDKLYSALLSEDEMQNTQIALIAKRLQSIKGYQKMFNEISGSDNSAISGDSIINALAAYIRGLQTPAPIDCFIAGDDSALSAKQIQGGHTFIEHDCYTCHTGTNFGGQMLQRIGIAEAWPNQTDTGYYQDTQIEAQRMFFRVSPLRNVEHTGPYFHDASSSKVWDAARKMAFYERGHQMNSSDAMLIQDFLKSLTGSIPKDYIKEPLILK